jgi:hypothetical protein
MSAESSPRSDSAVSVQDMEIAQLKQNIKQLQFHNNALQQECSDWKSKHQIQKDEVFRLCGASSRHGRQMKELEDRCSNAKSQLGIKLKETSVLRDDLAKARKRIREAELHAEAMEDQYKASSTNSGRFTDDELEFVRSQLNDLQQEHSQPQQVYVVSNCEEHTHRATQQVVDFQHVQQAAEAELGAHRHLEDANKLLQDQVLLVQEQLLEATRECRKNEATVLQLEKTIAIQCTNTLTVDGKAAELQAQFHEWSLASEVHASSHDADAFTKSTSSSSLTPPSIISSHGTNSTATTDSSVAANVIINIHTNEQKNWTLVKRIQSAISKTSKLDIMGPEDLVANLQAEMQRLEMDHSEQTAAAAHWQKVALAGLAEVDALRSEYQDRPLCVVAKHRALSDDLEAKTLQLQLQTMLVMHWQKKMASAQTFFEDSNAEMRDAGMQGF